MDFKFNVVAYLILYNLITKWFIQWILIGNDNIGDSE